MKINKAIEKSLPFTVAIASILLLLYFIIPNTFHNQYVLIALGVLYCHPLLVLFISIKKPWWILSEVFVCIFILLIIGADFRKLRDYLPPAEIGRSAVVGYTQFYGYPFYLDTIIFFILTLHPVVLFLFLKFLERHKWRKS